MRAISGSKGKRKRAQTEILGLAVVVLVIAFAALFSLRFFINRGEDSTREDYLVREMGAKFLTAFFKTTTECRHLSMTELYQDCASSASAAGDIVCGGKGSCEFIQDETEAALRSVLERYNRKRYSFNATTPSKRLVSAGNMGNCRSYKSSIYAIPVSQGTSVFVKLDICKR